MDPLTMFSCPFRHDTTLQQHRLLSITANVTSWGAARTSQNAHSLKLLAGSGVVAPPLYCCVSYVRTKRVRSCVHKKRNSRGYGRPLAVAVRKAPRGCVSSVVRIRLAKHSLHTNNQLLHTHDKGRS